MTHQPHNSLEALLTFLDRLEGAHISYSLDQVRDAVMVLIAIQGQRWEVEFFADGQIEVERFISSGTIEYEDAIQTLFTEYGA